MEYILHAYTVCRLIENFSFLFSDLTLMMNVMMLQLLPAVEEVWDVDRFSISHVPQKSPVDLLSRCHPLGILLLQRLPGPSYQMFYFFASTNLCNQPYTLL